MAAEKTQRKQRTRIGADALNHRRILKESFPTTGKVRVPQAAAYIGIGISTFWAYVDDGRVKPPVKFGARVSVWDAEYIRELAANGIPAKAAAA